MMTYADVGRRMLCVSKMAGEQLPHVLQEAATLHSALEGEQHALRTLLRRMTRETVELEVFSLLALLVQKYKY